MVEGGLPTARPFLVHLISNVRLLGLICRGLGHTHLRSTDNPYSGGTCYGLSHAAMVAWVKEFSDTYHSLAHRSEFILHTELPANIIVSACRYPVIYTTTNWWTECTGNSGEFAENNPLWLADYSSSAGQLPAGWKYYSFWQ